MASERERLAGLYAEMGDGELQRMAGAPEELTDDGRAALAGEMRRRGFSAVAVPASRDVAALNLGPVVVSEEEERQSGFGAAIPGVVPAGSMAVEQAVEPVGEERLGMARLLLFYDGIELTRACAVLEEVGIAPAIEEVAGDGVMGVSPHFEVWVETGAQERAREALRGAMGLFPVAEVEGAAVENDGVVGVFETEREAEEVRGMLARHRFSARVEAQGEDAGYGVLVTPGEQERALTVVARGLGVE